MVIYVIEVEGRKDRPDGPRKSEEARNIGITGTNESLRRVPTTIQSEEKRFAS